MKIGNGWTKNTEDGKTYISISLDDTLCEVFPQLKAIEQNCFMTLFNIPKEERKTENSPGWVLNVDKKRNKKESSELIQEEEIPF